MSIFSGLFRSRDKPTNATSGSSYRFFMGGSTSGKNVAQGDGPFVLTICVRSRRGFLSSGRFDGLTGPHSSTPGCISRGTLRRSLQRLSAPLRQRACIIDCRQSYR